MVFIYLSIVVIMLVEQSVFNKFYSIKTGGKGVFVLTVLMSLSAALIFLLTGGKLNFERGILPYSCGFAISYLVCMVFNLAAIKCGSLALTSLVTSYSLMIPTLYGLVFLHEEAKFELYIGIALLIISILLMNFNSEKHSVSLKWGIFAFLSFLGNGMCSVVQKMEQIKFDGGYKNEFMLTALMIVIIFAIFGVIKSERQEWRYCVRKGWYFCVAIGIGNALVNYLIMVVSHLVNASVMFPVISAGGIIMTFIISQTLFKEKFSKQQFWGFVLGVLSVIFLSI